jgi:hypothetical protein
MAWGGIHRGGTKRVKGARFIGAIIGDAAGVVVGDVTTYPVPISLILELGPKFTPRWLRSSTFLNEQLPLWPSIYKDEVGGCLKLNYCGSEWILPLTVVLDATPPNTANLEMTFRRSDQQFILSDKIRAATEEALKLQIRRLKYWRRFRANETYPLEKIPLADGTLVTITWPKVHG